MKIIVEEIKTNPFIVETAPYAGVRNVKVSLRVEEGDDFPNYSNKDIVEYPHVLYVHKLKDVIGKESKNEFTYENLTVRSKKLLNEWIEKLK